MTAERARRFAAVVAVVVVGVVAAFVALNGGAATGPAPGAEEAAQQPQRAAEAPRDRPLVEQMLDRLSQGRSATGVDDPVRDADVPQIEVAGSVPVGRLAVPAMDLSTTYFEGVHDAVINKGPGHWPGTPLPGQPGNAVFSGHRATHGAEFVDLDVLQPGDRINVRVGGAPYTYAVLGTSIVEESRYVPYVTRQPADPDAHVLTLFACNPVWDSTHRIVVRAELVGGGSTGEG